MNIGLNRVYNNFKMNGPGYVSSQWDGNMTSSTAIRDFTDGTSNTVIFSEWVKGPAALPAKDGLGVVYFSGILTTNSVLLLPNQFAANWRDAQICQNTILQLTNPSRPDQAWGWKGEWYTFGGTQVYSHINTPNRKQCEYNDVYNNGSGSENKRGSTTMIGATSAHPGGVNTLMADGSVRYIKSSVNYITWYALATPNGGEAISGDAF